MMREGGKERLIELFRQARGGDEAAKGAIFSELYEPIYRYFRLRTKVPDEALDLSQTTFLKFYRSLSSFEESSSPASLVFTIARNTLIDFWRRNKTKSIISSDEIVENMAEVKAAPERKSDIDIYELLSPLSDREREAVVLKYVEDLETREIGRVMGKSEEAVRQLISRGLRKARENAGDEFLI